MVDVRVLYVFEFCLSRLPFSLLWSVLMQKACCRWFDDEMTCESLAIVLRVWAHLHTCSSLSLSVSFGLSSFGWDSHIHLTAQSIIHIWYDEWHEKSIQHTPSEAASSSSSSSSNVHTASYPFLTAISCIDNIFNCIQLLALSLSLWIMAYNLFSCHCWFGLWWWWRRYLYYQQIKRLMVNSAETQTLTSNRLYISFEMLIDLFSFYCVVSIEIAAHCSLFFIFPNFCGDKRILCRTKIA